MKTRNNRALIKNRALGKNRGSPPGIPREMGREDRRGKGNDPLKLGRMEKEVQKGPVEKKLPTSC